MGGYTYDIRVSPAAKVNGLKTNRLTVGAAKPHIDITGCETRAPRSGERVSFRHEIAASVAPCHVEAAIFMVCWNDW